MALVALALLLDFLRTDEFLSYVWQIRSNHRFLYPVYTVLTGMVSLVYPTIGALIVTRLPRNPVGWIFCGVGLLYQLHHFALAYSNYALAEGFSLTLAGYAAWFSAWVGFAGLVSAGVFLKLAAQGARDMKFLEVVNACEGQTATQIKWLRTRMKQAAPQALLVAS